MTEYNNNAELQSPLEGVGGTAEQQQSPPEGGEGAFSAEYQEILGIIPPWILRWGITMLFAIIAVLLAGSWFFKYPDTIQATMILTSETPPAHIIAKTNGRIKELYVKNNQQVSAGEYLAVLENPASTNDMLQLKRNLETYIQAADFSAIFPQSGLQLGAVQNVYTEFIRSVNTEQQRAGNKNQLELRILASQLLNEINTWELNFALKSPIDGTVTFVGYWSENQNVVVGETVFSVVCVQENNLIGKAQLPIMRSGKVKMGQTVNIRFLNYPDNEFGMVKGEVSTISLVPVNDYYSAEISLPNGLLTTYNKTLPVSQGMTANIEIITEDMRLIERFILPLKRLWKERG